MSFVISSDCPRSPWSATHHELRHLVGTRRAGADARATGKLAREPRRRCRRRRHHHRGLDRWDRRLDDAQRDTICRGLHAGRWDCRWEARRSADSAPETHSRARRMPGERRGGRRRCCPSPAHERCGERGQEAPKTRTRTHARGGPGGRPRQRRGRRRGCPGRRDLERNERVLCGRPPDLELHGGGRVSQVRARDRKPTAARQR